MQSLRRSSFVVEELGGVATSSLINVNHCYSVLGVFLTANNKSADTVWSPG